MRVALLLSLASLTTGLATATSVDVFVDMEAGFNNTLVTTNLLNAVTHGNAGVWSLSPPGLTTMRITTAVSTPLAGPVIAGGKTYTDYGSTRSIAFQNSTDQSYARYTLNTPTRNVSIGMYLRLGGFTGSTYGSYDIIAMEGNDDFAVLNFQDFPGSEFVWQVHTQAKVGAPIHIQPNKTYWITMLWDQDNRLAHLKVYDPADWSLVGTSTWPLEPQACETVCFGRYDAHGYTSPANHYYDDLMIDVTNARFPLMPGLDTAGRTPISLSIVGGGTVLGASDTALLMVGHTYTLTAKPAPGFVFGGWSGSVTSATATLRVTMETNLALTATFVTNLFPAVKGTYNGLFYNSADTQPYSSGYATLTVNSVGSYSGRLQQNGRSYSLHGTLSGDGSGVQVIPRPGTNALKAYLSLDLTNNTDQVTGSVTEEDTNGVLWSAELVLDRAVYSKTNPCPGAGKYTLFIPCDTNSPGTPVGVSVGTLGVTTMGALTFAGKLSDGTTAAQRTVLSKAGFWPLYTSLYRGQGALLGTPTVDTNAAMTDFSGPLIWFKGAQPTARYYPGGFTNTTTLAGSRYVPPVAPALPLNFADGMLTFTNDQLALDFADPVQFTPTGTLVNQSTNKLSVHLNKTSGLLTGTVTPPGGSKAMPFAGALLQKQEHGTGYFLGTNQSGLLMLGP